ncbi:hypothetical protein M0804_007680 [Polistes exclamans]|nr:hypothetical protein M0804_007680 [Polistes exclamans]
MIFIYWSTVALSWTTSKANTNNARNPTGITASKSSWKMLFRVVMMMMMMMMMTMTMMMTLFGSSCGH